MIDKFRNIIFLLLGCLTTVVLHSQTVILDGNSAYVKYIPKLTTQKIITSSAGDVFLYPDYHSTVVNSLQEGEPFVQYLPVNFIVPGPDLFSAELIKYYYTEVNAYRIIPFDYEMMSQQNFSDIELSERYFEYSFPERFFEMNYLGISTDHHLAQLRVYPYKIENGSLFMLDSIEIKVNFRPYYEQQGAPILNTVTTAVNLEQARFWGISTKSQTKDIPNLLENDIIRDLREVSSGNWLKISLNEEGIYRIDASQLSSSGANIASINPATIKLFGKGGRELSELVSDALNNDLDEQAIYVFTKPDGTLDYIVFYGAPTVGFEKFGSRIRHFKNNYTNETHYLLTWGGRNGKRAIFANDVNKEIINRPTNYVHRVLFDEDLLSPYVPPAGRIWFGRTFFSNPFNPIMLHNLDRTGTIFYRLGLAHNSDSGGNFNIFEGSEQIGTLNLRPISRYIFAIRGFGEYTLPANKIGNDNRSMINLKYNNPNLSSSIAYFDFFEIHYPRSFYAIDNELSFLADTNLNGVTEFTINGFSGQTIFGFEVSNPANPQAIKNTAVTGGMFKFVQELERGDYKKYYISAKVKSPKILPTELANLRGNKYNADVIVLTHPDLLASANEFKDYRESTSNLKIQIVLTNHVYNEFSCGAPDVAALRDYVAYAWHNWDVKPRYLVLWGDGHYDMKNLATSKTNHIPAHQSFVYYLESFDEIHSAWSSDDFYGLIVGNDDLLDISIGRITIESNEEGRTFLNKLKHYENNSSLDQWRTNIILLADDGPTQGKAYEGTLHTGQSEVLANDVINIYGKDMQYDKLYLVEYPTENIPNGRLKPKVNQDLLSKVNTTGGLLLNWVGHGNPRIWAHEQILERDVTIPQMTNYDKLFFLIAATCDFGRFDNPETRSGAEEMVLSRRGAAIASFSATRIVYSQFNAELAYQLYRLMLSRNSDNNEYYPLGDIIRLLKQDFTGVNDKKYFLLGDPTMKLLLPENRVHIDIINGINLNETANETIEIPALSEVTIQGRITYPDGITPKHDFNGTILITLRDGDIEYRITEYFLGIPRDQFYFRKLGPALNRSSYVVENGMFTANFIIPKDISFSPNRGRLFVYAYSNDGQFAKGSYHNLRIDGYDATSIEDRDGPKIDLYLDSRNFIAGDIVTSKPKLIVDLFDDSGINTTGLGIGHKIEAWIDNSPISIDLTNRFTTSLVDSRSGAAETFLFGLTPGRHTVRVRAWDVFNNFSVAETYFFISSAGDGSLANIKYNYPNPFSDDTKFIMNHNMPPPFEARLKVFSTDGVLVRDIKTSVNTYHTSEITWDGKDNLGNAVSQGVYIIQIEIPTENGDWTIVLSKAVKLN